MDEAREQLIEILRKPIFPHELADPTEAVADYLLDNGVTIQRWIPVTKRLPERDGSYLVASVTGKVYAAHWYTEKKCSGGYVRKAAWSHPNITHWMPLPQAPGKEGA